MNFRKQPTTLPVVITLAAACLSGCDAGLMEQSGAGSDDRLVVGMSDGVLATDPASGYDPGSWLVFNNVFQSLLSFPNGATEPRPEIAEECSFTDEQVETFRCTLKDGLKFSTGDPLTAEDVKFTFDRIRRIDDPAGPAVMFQNLKSVETPDATTVVCRLRLPDATFPSKIASGAGSIVSRAHYDANGLRGDGKAVGSGPYELDSFTKDEAVFSVNEEYTGSAEVRNAGITLKFFQADQEALKKALLAGRVDLAYRGLSAHDLADMGNGSGGGVDVVEGTGVEVQHLVFNMEDSTVGKHGVRRAVAHLLDRDALVEDVHRNTAIPLYSIIPSGIPGHNTAFFDTYGAAPSRTAAADAIKSAGVTGKVKLTLWSTPARYGPATDQALKDIAGQLNSSGLFQADVKSVPFERYERDIQAGRYGVYVKGWVPDYPDADNFTAPFFGEGNVLGNHYKNGTITRTLIPRTAAERNRAATNDEFDRLQSIVAEDLPVLPLWQSKQAVAVRDDIRGYQYCLDVSTVFRFWELYRSTD
ncbi:MULTISPECIES: ABC transporter substrate-binding protein [Streptomyces]|uniref:ABC transporter substrate-binding protein n=1 Tax=Streptomyces TaxID=1883 RepID=UPI00240DC532|nr:MULTISPECIES: ABC transporter substrate-binding protein [Streptomyces]WFB88524.1 ABC transporter substrate-binding protein [Streptomyces olivaceus]WGK50666.1 ABC transporter substrate-binding protein [Streptomyces sp. B146]